MKDIKSILMTANVIIVCALGALLLIRSIRGRCKDLAGVAALYFAVGILHLILGKVYGDWGMGPLLAITGILILKLDSFVETIRSSHDTDPTV